METLVLLLVFAALFALGNALAWWLLLRRGRGDAAPDAPLLLLQQQMQELTRAVHERLQENARVLDARLSESASAITESSRQLHDSMKRQLSESLRVVREVTQGLTKLDETNKQVISFADQLQHLQDILKNPKQRGVLGEYFLESVLQNTLPPESYTMQYRFADGEVVDAAIFIKDKIVPIDAKFSLENYNRMQEARDPALRVKWEKAFVNDLKQRIKETSKYIRPKEGTMEFAFMFIPHEAIYYDLLVNKIGADESLLERAAGEYRVLLTSPTSFLAYLQTVLQGLRALQIEEQAQEIMKRVRDLGRHLGAYDTYMQKLGNALSTTVNAYNAAHKELGKIDKDVVKITGEEKRIAPLSLDKPRRGEE